MTAKREFIQCRADRAIVRAIETTTRKTRLTRAEVMRQALFIGLPELEKRMTGRQGAAAS